MAAFDGVPPEQWAQLARVLDAGVDDLSTEAQARAAGRASRRLGVEQLDARDDEHLRVLWDELRSVVLRASLERLTRKGELRVVGTAGDGQLLYERTDPAPAPAPGDKGAAGGFPRSEPGSA